MYFMKTLLLTFIFLGSIVAVSAQDSTDNKKNVPGQELERQRIPLRELPHKVKTSLENPEYTGWKIDKADKAFLIGSANPESIGRQIYIVELKRGAERVTVRLDQDGKRIDQDDGNDR
jgi:hypothetical protein